MSGQHYCLRWNNYQTNMTSVFHTLLQNEDFVDVTLACNNVSLKAHKVVLSACSSYFQKLLLENPCKHPTIIMPQDVCYEDLKFIIEFVYKGEIDVSQKELQSLLRTADQLKIKGLCESPSEEDDQVTTTPKANRDASPKRLRYVDTKKQPSDYQKTKERPSPERKETEEGKIGSAEREDEMPVALDDTKRRRLDPEQTKPLNMSSHAMVAEQTIFSQFGVDNDDFPPEPSGPSAIPVEHLDLHENSPSHNLPSNSSIHRTDLSDATVKFSDIKKESIDIKFETLRGYDQESMSDSRMSMGSREDTDQPMQSMMVTPELFGLMPGLSNDSDGIDYSGKNGHSDGYMGNRQNNGPKTWTQEDMDLALDALRNHNMSLTKASATYGIPSTTLWQRAHRLGIDTPKKEGPTKSWTEESLNSALDALRTGSISANKASKAFGIPSSTLYKIARREGIRLAAPFNAAPTTWTPEDLEKALESIRSGQTSVQKASTEFGIPTGTLYGRCKREGIELSRSNPTPWSEDAMGEALEAVRLGHMSINQAAIHYNLPYSSLYGRFKRGFKFDAEHLDMNSDSQSHLDQVFMDYGKSEQEMHYEEPPNS